ncbi:MAG: ABC transporter permease [Geminicoccaceae bacterium]
MIVLEREALPGVRGHGRDGAAATPLSGADRRRRLRALVVKEALQIVRDPSSVLIAVVLPLILLFLFGYGVSLDANQLRIGIAIESGTPPARELAAAFQASRFFDARLAHDRRTFVPDLVAGRIRGIVVIPATFTAEAERSDGAPRIQVITDGSEPNTASFVQNYARGVVATFQRQRAAEGQGRAPAIAAVQRFWFNPGLERRFFLVPGSIAIVMTLIGTLLTALVVAREWERGTMEAIMATPIGVAELLVGKLLPYFGLALASMILCTVVAVLLFDVPFRGSPGALLVLSIAFLCPALGQGLLISAVTKNQFVAAQAALLSGFLPAFLLSGFIFEISSMPTPIQWLTTIVPARYLIPSLQTVFLAGDIWPLFLPDIGAMLLIGAVLFALAVRATPKRLA